MNESNAQIPVNVTFDPPSPVSPGVTRFRCDFVMGKLNSAFTEFKHVISRNPIGL